MQTDKSCQAVEQYLAYLITIKGRSQNTVLEYRLDLLQFFKYVDNAREENHSNFRFADIDFIHSISLSDMYGFLAYCQDTLHSSPGTRTRKIVSIRQFWKYLKTKVHLIDNNIAEELETPKRFHSVGHEALYEHETLGRTQWNGVGFRRRLVTGYHMANPNLRKTIDST